MEIPESIPNRLSRVDRINKVNQSIIDNKTSNIQVLLSDDTIGAGTVALALQHLGEAQVDNLADYANRKATIHKGKAFVKLCNKLLREKGVVQ